VQAHAAVLHTVARLLEPVPVPVPVLVLVLVLVWMPGLVMLQVEGVMVMVPVPVAAGRRLCVHNLQQVPACLCPPRPRLEPARPWRVTRWACPPNHRLGACWPRRVARAAWGVVWTAGL